MLLQQLLVPRFLARWPGVHDQNLIGVADRREPVRNYGRCPPVHQFADGLVYPHLGIDIGCGFVDSIYAYYLR